jgi:hypothetical protein
MASSRAKHHPRHRARNLYFPRSGRLVCAAARSVVRYIHFQRDDAPAVGLDDPNSNSFARVTTSSNLELLPELGQQEAADRAVVFVAESAVELSFRSSIGVNA